MPDTPSTCSGVPKPTGPGHTPFGEWKCVNGVWTWIPSYGRSANEEPSKENEGDS